MTTSQRILWGRVILYGVLTEAVLTIIFVAGLAIGVTAAGKRSLRWSAPSCCHCCSPSSLGAVSMRDSVCTAS